MADIDQIIARAQLGGDFGPRRRFSLESSRAFEKMRKFALPDPHHYILELLQGAVANGAEYLDLTLSKDRLRLSYVGSGSGFSASRLEGLFEAIFSAQDNEEEQDLRALAMAFNTLYALSFERIVVESGDGTTKGSCRMEIVGDEITVGEPTSPLQGTFIVVEGGGRNPEKEEELLVERCISSNVPICLDGRFLFSSRGEKFPMPFGYRNCLHFDEGDLYGTIGVNVLDREPGFKVMVHGVHLWTFQFPEMKLAGRSNTAEKTEPSKVLGGIICFNRLHKTVDHADVVRDAVWGELWARIKPYAEKVLGLREDVSPSKLQVLGDPAPTFLRHAKERLHGVGTLVLVDPKASSAEQGRASIVAELLEGLPVLVERALMPVVESLVGRDVSVIAPSLKDASVMAFFNQDFAPSLDDVGSDNSLPSRNLADFSKQEMLEIYGRSLSGALIEGRLFYTKRSGQGTDGVRVRFISFGRVVWEGTIESTYRGTHLEVLLPAITPEQLERQYGAEKLAGELVLSWCVEFEHYLEDEFSLMLEAGVEALSRGAHTLLARIEAGFHLSFQGWRGTLRGDFRGWEKHSTALRNLKVFRTLEGEDVSLHHLRKLMNQCGGLVYGARAREDNTGPIAAADLDGLDLSRILLVDGPTENALVTLLGRAGYVSIDGRDVLAQAGEIVLRDVALGLRDYPDSELLAEKLGGEACTQDEVREHHDDLLDSLAGPVLELLHSARKGELLRPTAEAEEWLRQAVRHLQWAAVHASRIGFSVARMSALREMPLFVTIDNALVSLCQLEGRLVHGGFIPVVEGFSQDIVQVALDSPLSPIREEADARFSLAANHYVVTLLGGIVPLQSALSQKRLRPITSIDNGGALVVTRFRADSVKGTLGVAASGADSVISILRKGMPTEWISGELNGLRLVGQLHVPGGEAVNEVLARECTRLLKKLIRAVQSPQTTRSASQKAEAIAIALLGYLSAHSRWKLDGLVGKTHVNDTMAEQVIGLSLLTLNDGSLTTPQRVLYTMRVSPSVEIALSSTQSPEILAWVRASQGRLWDLLVSNGLRLASMRPYQDKETDYAANVEEIFEIAGPPEVKCIEDAHQEERVEAAPLAELGRKAEQVESWLSASKGKKAGPTIKSYKVRDGRLVSRDVEQRLIREPRAPWEAGEATVGVETNGTLDPKFVAWIIQYWMAELGGIQKRKGLTSVHFRSVEGGHLGGTVELIVPDFPTIVRWHEPPVDATLKLGRQKYASTSKDWVVRAYADERAEMGAHLAIVFNFSAKIVLSALRSVEDLERLFPTLLLAAYSAANYRFTSIHAGHEQEFQEAVMDRLIEGKSFFSVAQLPGKAEHGLRVQ